MTEDSKLKLREVINSLSEDKAKLEQALEVISSLAEDKTKLEQVLQTIEDEQPEGAAQGEGRQPGAAPQGQPSSLVVEPAFVEISIGVAAVVAAISTILCALTDIDYPLKLVLVVPCAYGNYIIILCIMVSSYLLCKKRSFAISSRRST